MADSDRYLPDGTPNPLADQTSAYVMGVTSPEVLLNIPASAGAPAVPDMLVGDQNAFNSTRYAKAYLTASVAAAGAPLILLPQTRTLFQNNSVSDEGSPFSTFFQGDGNAMDQIGVTPEQTEFVVYCLAVDAEPAFSAAGDTLVRPAPLDAYGTKLNETLNFRATVSIKVGNTCTYGPWQVSTLPYIGGNRTGGALGSSGTNNGAGVQGLCVAFAVPMVWQDNRSQWRPQVFFQIDQAIQIDPIPGAALPPGNYYIAYTVVASGRARCRTTSNGCSTLTGADLIRIRQALGMK